MKTLSAVRRIFSLLLAAAVVQLCGAPAHAQSPLPAESPTPIADENRDARVDRYRQIIENRDDSAATRTAQAEELLETGWPEAYDAVVRLLANGDDPTVKSILCQAIANVGRRTPDRLDSRLVDPLLGLLDHTDDEVARRAGEALSTFTHPEVTEALSKVAADRQKPLRTRLIALSALTPNTQRREVAEALVELLSAEEPQMRAGAIDALRGLSLVDFGVDVERWRNWWSSQSLLSDRAWLDMVLRVRSQRLRRTEQAFEAYRAEADQRYYALAGRLQETLANLFRQTPQAERDGALTTWLSDSNTEFRRAAAKLVAEQISEGNLPSDAVRAALVRRYGDESADVRRLAVEIVGALNEPGEATAMLQRLKVEQDDAVRESILRQLGKLRNPEVVDPLIEELMRPGATDACVSAAAEALGTLAARGGLPEDATKKLIEPLKLRFAQTDPAARKVRIAILGAMAATGAPEFKPEFEAHLAAEDPELLLRAIQGVALVGNGAQLDRLSNLATHPDARVRQRAIAAIGDLGGLDQLSVVVARMSPGVETIEGPREAAWQAFRRICERLPVDAQVAAADRLVDLPTQRAQYLKELNDRLVKSSPASPELARVREALARTYGALGRNGEALPYWQALFNDGVAAKDARRHDWALAFLDCAAINDKLELIPNVLTALLESDDRSRRAAETAVIACLDRLQSSGREADAAALASRLQNLPPDAYPALNDYLPTLADAAPVTANTSGLN
ncbi:MAG TPA: HEAT repeat domain-containing protein [Phycisphaerae bacterium]|nr:HEAT repeat domain-containing protein [Phycisphaerae bacterium]